MEYGLWQKWECEKKKIALPQTSGLGGNTEREKKKTLATIEASVKVVLSPQL